MKLARVCVLWENEGLALIGKRLSLRNPIEKDLRRGRVDMTVSKITLYHEINSGEIKIHDFFQTKPILVLALILVIFNSLISIEARACDRVMMAKCCGRFHRLRHYNTFR